MRLSHPWDTLDVDLGGGVFISRQIDIQTVGTALRSPSTSLFWQSDGPQPHYLNIHFFKVVEIVAMRIYLDFDQDESYTPTKIAFLAGMGEMDLQEWGVMSFVEPRGWVNVDFEGVGAVDGSDDDVSGSDDELGDDESEDETGRRRKKLPVLRAMLVQVKILENHQNGKDTHLRGLQIFARDEAFRERRADPTTLPAGTGRRAEAATSKRKKPRGMPEPDFGIVELR
ncbi:putative anaphase-promoting complex subunit 10 [Diplodia seriata]|uniref:Putative anaphase-promoting complex subunit 10 n=1 Tax=Diplodia seriata TaxID=420778 RepID=A0A0G2FVF3_9PEZI|nr:putative anaphase-promoting complex subunit 10 [Diplodia seriata]